MTKPTPADAIRKAADDCLRWRSAVVLGIDATTNGVAIRSSNPSLADLALMHAILGAQLQAKIESSLQPASRIELPGLPS